MRGRLETELRRGEENEGTEIYPLPRLRTTHASAGSGEIAKPIRPRTGLSDEREESRKRMIVKPEFETESEAFESLASEFEMSLEKRSTGRIFTSSETHTARVFWNAALEYAKKAGKA